MDTFDLTAKQRSRVLFRKFIKRNLPNPQRARVLCLPGPEAIEIFEVYDKLGIPRENITCLERNADSALRIARNAPGVTVLNFDFNDLKWLIRAKGPFEIVSLDTMAQIGTVEGFILDFDVKQSGLRTLSDRAIVFTNFCGNREKEKTGGVYVKHLANRLAGEAAENPEVYRLVIDDEKSFASAVREAAAKADVSTAFDYKGDAIHLEVLSWLKLDRDVRRSDSFKYVCSRTPMYGDMFFVEKTSLDTRAKYSAPVRRFLGSESYLRAAPITVEEAKQETIRLKSLHPSMPVREIADRIGWPRIMQISAWAAHVTMGTYK